MAKNVARENTPVMLRVKVPHHVWQWLHEQGETSIKGKSFTAEEFAAGALIDLYDVENRQPVEVDEDIPF